MRICFIAGDNNSGQCGITDYVELLAQELENLGHQIDQYFLKKGSGEVTDMPNADLYSVQFAPYAFDAKGIPNQILKSLSRKLKNRKVHLNFHEIWVGAYPRANWKEKLIGYIQKNLILGFIKKCKPDYITSSNAGAIDRLKQIGVPATFLYLFGNIPYSEIPNVSANMDRFKVAFFGTPYSDFPYDKLFDFLLALIKTCNRELEMIMIGRQREDTATDRILSLCKKNSFSSLVTGELSTDLISKQLQECTLGISTTPFDVIGKSGATAAMIEHGLPILAYDDGDTPQESLFIPNQFKDQIFLINNDSAFDKLIHYLEKPRKSFFDGIAHTANKMLKLVS